MPINYQQKNHEPEYLDWSDRDEVWIARGHINGYGTFTCHGNSLEHALDIFEEFSKNIHAQMIDEGEINLDNTDYWTPATREETADAFGFDIVNIVDDDFGFSAPACGDDVDFILF